MKTICTKCKSENVSIVDDRDEEEKEPEVQTMDEMVHRMFEPIPLVYKVTTWRCADCGYSISR